MVLLEMLEAFDQPPALLLKFSSSSGAHEYSMPMPVSLHQFMVSTPMPLADFRTKWDRLVAPELQASVAFTTALR